MTNEEIISELGFDAASAEMKERVVENVRTIVEMRLVGMIGDLIGDEQKAKLDELIAAGDNQAVWSWLRNDIVGVDVSELYDAALKDYIENYKQDPLDTDSSVE